MVKTNITKCLCCLTVRRKFWSKSLYTLHAFKAAKSIFRILISLPRKIVKAAVRIKQGITFQKARRVTIADLDPREQFVKLKKKHPPEAPL